MAASEIAAVGGAILVVAATVREIGNTYYKATAAWKEFPEQVEQLRRKLDNFQAQLERYGLSEEPDILTTMKAAKALVEEEEKKLKKEKARRESREGGVSGRPVKERKFTLKSWRGVVWEMIFPEKVGKAIENATKACDKILQNLTEKQEWAERLRTEVRNARIALPFREDSEYVPLPQTELQIRRLLEGKPHTVVQLYGRAGSGKSTLVRQVCLHFQKKDSSAFSHVALIEGGGSGESVHAKQLELLQNLGWDFSEISEMTSKPRAFEQVIHGRLQNLLREVKLLIVLDDVEDLQLLQSLLNLSGPNVKYLVASREENLCRDLNRRYNPAAVEMEHLHRSDAQKILAGNAGFQDQKIPEPFQEMAERILDQAEDIPLVIATIGARIRNAGKDDTSIWAFMSNPENFSESLVEGRPQLRIHGYRSSA